MFTIRKQFAFSASHQLEGLAEGHPCMRLHGHNYTVEVELQSPDLGPDGFVRDFGDFKELGKYLDDTFDHQHINDVFEGQTSSERIALHLYQWCHQRWPETACVRVSETPKSWAEYRP